MQFLWVTEYENMIELSVPRKSRNFTELNRH